MRITLLMFLAACKAPTPTAEGVDADGDGFAEGEDCNDNDAAVFPGAPERCDDLDQDCDGDTNDAGAVHIEGGAAAADLTEALLRAQINETIVLCPGTHAAAVVRDRVLEGRGDGVIIDARGVGSAIQAIGRVELRNLTLTGGVGSPGPLGGAVGGGLNATAASQVNLADVIVEGNTADHGGGIAAGPGPIGLERVVIRGNDAVSGGGVHLQEGVLTCADTLIEGNDADSGGGIRVTDGTVAGCDVLGNVAVDNGGGIYVAGTSEVRGTTIGHNTSVVYGGGLYLLPSTDLTLQGSTVQDNTSELGGGIFANPGSELDLTASTLTGNLATAEGGGLYAWTATVAGGTITGNQATDFAGGVAIFEGGSLSGARIENNTAASGAGMRVRGEGLATIAALQVLGNQATQNGGGIYLRDAQLNVDSVVVSGNSAVERGGGLYFANASMTGDDLLVTQNDADVGGGGYVSSAGAASMVGSYNANTAATGAGIAALGSAALNVGLAGNEASVRAGGLYADGVGVVVEGTVVCQNNTAAEFGGGIYAQDSSSIELESSDIDSNVAPLGAGVYINGGSTVSLGPWVIVQSNQDGNPAGGGGVRINDGTLVTDETTFAGNSPFDVYTVGNSTGVSFPDPVTTTCTQAGCPTP